jgi:hypothetical protein
MKSTQSPSPLAPDYLATLHRLLELATQTAETAGAEGNHRLVLQAIREGARIVTLLLKLTSSPDRKPGRQPQTPTKMPGLDSLLNAVLSGDRNSQVPPVPLASALKPAQRQPENDRRPVRADLGNLNPLPSDLPRDLLQGLFHRQPDGETLTPAKRQWEKSGK